VGATVGLAGAVPPEPAHQMPRQLSHEAWSAAQLPWIVAVSSLHQDWRKLPGQPQSCM